MFNHRVWLVFALLGGFALGAQAESEALTAETIEGWITGLAPAGVLVESWELEGDKVSIDGTAAASRQVSAFMKALDGSDHFRNVVLQQIESTGGRQAFTFRLTLE